MTLFPIDIVSYVKRIFETQPETKLFEIHNNRMICQDCLERLYADDDAEVLIGILEIYDCSVE